MNLRRTIKTHSIRLFMGVIMATAVAWLAAPLVGPSWWIRLLVFGGSLGAVGTIFQLEIWQLTAAERAASRYVEMLCRLDCHDLADPQAFQSLPQLAEGDRWRA